MKDYWKRLKAHPGLEVAIVLSIMLPGAGLGNQTWQGGVICGAVFAALAWVVVLWTARTQPLPQPPKEGE